MAPVPGKPTNLWPYGILAFFLFIIAATVVFVILSMRQKVDLVSTDYYEQEMRFQDQIDRVRRTAALRESAAISLDEVNQRLTVQLPAAHATPGTRGFVAFYRPSEAGLDRRVPLALDDKGVQFLDIKGMVPGLWRVRVTWKVDAEEFYGETNIVAGRVKR